MRGDLLGNLRDQGPSKECGSESWAVSPENKSLSLTVDLGMEERKRNGRLLGREVIRKVIGRDRRLLKKVVG